MTQNAPGTRTSGCYICDPENPDAAPDGCDDCEDRWLAYFEVAYADEIEAESRRNSSSSGLQDGSAPK